MKPLSPKEGEDEPQPADFPECFLVVSDFEKNLRERHQIILSFSRKMMFVIHKPHAQLWIIVSVDVVCNMKAHDKMSFKTMSFRHLE